MAGLERLTSKIYHERQARGSMLCAQHALNSLLQGNYFTAPDLSVIARSIDHLEEQYEDARRGLSSRNVDDTGFFSLQVIERALEVWGLTPIRWRSEEMRPLHSKPETQQAFILNQDQHWYTIRRFGSDPGHWYDLNSTHRRPKWVGRLYLGMVLQQAETEGYSIFTVRSFADPTSNSPLLPCPADEVASEITDASIASSSSNPTASDAQASQASPQAHGEVADLGEDLELQAALEASLMGGASNDFLLPSSRSAQTVLEPLSFPPGLSSSFPEPHDDPVAASAARGRAMLARVQAEQTQALRERYDDEIERFEAMMRARERVAERRTRMDVDADDDDDDADFYDADGDSFEAAPDSRPGSSQNRAHTSVNDDDDMGSVTGREWRPSQQDALYQDASTLRPRPDAEEDADLAAAIKASLEDTGPEIPLEPQMVSTSSVTVEPPPLPSAPSADVAKDDGDAVEQPEAAAEEVSVDEMRRRRLARFGG